MCIFVYKYSKSVETLASDGVALSSAEKALGGEYLVLTAAVARVKKFTLRALLDLDDVGLGYYKQKLCSVAFVAVRRFKGERRLDVVLHCAGGYAIVKAVGLEYDGLEYVYEGYYAAGVYLAVYLYLERAPGIGAENGEIGGADLGFLYVVGFAEGAE